MEEYPCAIMELVKAEGISVLQFDENDHTVGCTSIMHSRVCIALILLVEN